MDEELKELWEKTLDIIKGELSEVSFNTWIKSCEPISMSSNIIKISVPNAFTQEILEKRYKDLVANSIKAICSKLYNIEFLIASEIQNSEEDESEKKHNNLKSNKKVIVNDEMTNNLNPKYTFDSFVIGNSNRFAHAASLAVAESPAKAYNPLFIYGGVGLGKTHLMHAIGHYVLKNNPNAKVVYVSSEKFTNELINAIKDDKNEEFRNKYRNVDVLLIDDIQFIAGKEGTQEEFFHTFNALHEANKQIIISSDRPPKEIPTLEDRLRSRFEMGLITDIQPPDFETRIAIIRRKAELLNLNLPDEVAEFIANRLKTNIRQLEGAVKKLKALKHLAGSPPTMAMAQSVIRDILNDDQPIPITVEKIIGEVANVYGVTPDDIRSNKRSAQISNARKVAIYVVREITQMSLVAIGVEFGGRDHSTIVYAINNVEHNLKKDESLREMVDDIIKNIRDKGK